jgi:hypothetical protein
VDEEADVDIGAFVAGARKGHIPQGPERCLAERGEGYGRSRLVVATSSQFLVCRRMSGIE